MHTCNSNKRIAQKIVLTWEEWDQMGSKGGGRKQYKWRSQTQFQVNVKTTVLYHLLLRRKSHLVLFLKSVSYRIKVEPRWKLRANLWPQTLFVAIDFFETCCLFLSFCEFVKRMKSPFHLLLLPSRDDACCQGDRYNPGDRPFLWAAPCDWPIDQRGGGGSADWAFWLAGWLA